MSPVLLEANVNGADSTQGPTRIGTKLLIQYLIDRTL